MNIKIFSLSVLALMLVSMSGMAASKTYTCANNVSLDRPGLQAKFNSLVSGDVLTIKGTCQLDSSSLVLRVSGVVVKGERGPLGIYKTVIKGLDVNNDGIPDEGPQGWIFYNRGLAIATPVGQDVIQNVTVKDLKFTLTRRGLDISAALGNTSSNLCNDTFANIQVNGIAKNIVIKDNLFYRTVRGPQVFGQNEHLTFENNIHLDAVGSDISTRTGIIM